MALSAHDESLMGIFHPFALARIKKAESTEQRFVHYTRAETALNIIKTNEVWMRNASSMDDPTEGHHGWKCVLAAFHSPAGRRFQTLLDAEVAGWKDYVAGGIDGWHDYFIQDTYISCFSELDTDLNGRLSMWREYSGGTGVAIVLNPRPFLRESHALKAYASPVEYLDEMTFTSCFTEVVQTLERNILRLRSVSADEVKFRLFNMFRYAIHCTKHPGYLEEKEWRVVYTPKLDQSKIITSSAELVKGLSEQIYKIPLQNIPHEGLHEITIAELIEHIIIGPCRDPSPLRNDLISALSRAGIKNSKARVSTSSIPVRFP